MSFLNQKKYREARNLLAELCEKYPSETEVLNRAKVFLSICESHLRRRREEQPSSAEEYFDRGVLHHNRGEYDQALECFAAALKMSRRDSGHIHYAMAATEVRLGNVDKALKSLKRAIELKEENRYYARNDPDFSTLGANEQFRELVGGPPGNPKLDDLSKKP
ncbi:MAG: tetratricopeptide repeat protein [Acidobacteria bacterium]|nr:tetratricopeptide repeat protein [Acidobacteriota bacterium]